MNEEHNTYIKFHAISKTHGFAVERMQKEWRIVFVRQEVKNGQNVLIKESTSYSAGKMHSYPSPFVAEHVIKTQILPLYKKAA